MIDLGITMIKEYIILVVNTLVRTCMYKSPIHILESVHWIHSYMVSRAVWSLLFPPRNLITIMTSSAINSLAVITDNINTTTKPLLTINISSMTKLDGRSWILCVLAGFICSIHLIWYQNGSLCLDYIFTYRLRSCGKILWNHERVHHPTESLHDG